MTTLHRMPTRPTVTDEDGEHTATDRELLNRDLIVVGTESGDEIVHDAGRGADHLPADAEKLTDVGDWSDARSGLPSSVADAVLESVHEADVDDGGGNVITVQIREKIGNGSPPNSDFRRRAGDPDPEAGPPFNVGTKQEVASDLPPHRWSGQ